MSGTEAETNAPHPLDVSSAVILDPEGVPELDREEIPDLIGDLERIKAHLVSRLHQPPERDPPPSDSAENPLEHKDHLLKAEDVAEIMDVSTRYVYDHADGWPFTRRISQHKLRFSERGLYNWLDSRNPDSVA